MDFPSLVHKVLVSNWYVLSAYQEVPGDFSALGFVLWAEMNFLQVH